MSPAYRPVSPGQLPALLAEHLHGRPLIGHALRVAVDGPTCARPDELAAGLLGPLRARGRPAVAIGADTFWRDASLRLEYGRQDVDSFPQWLDVSALRREVLEPLGPAGFGRYLPSLRDPITNRATRASARPAAAGSLVIISGGLLLGRELPFDVTIHLVVSGAGRTRRTAGDQQWTLPAYERYDADVRPTELADIVIRMDDPLHPAVQGLSG